ncbi:lengsin-like [Amphiura filiformis]|uniref:lengsin-like n=1 Tax=Amphiura filiformis TaxID=82378 RepID=UPI003B220296
MSKPSADHRGCSAHINHSLWDKDGKTNLLYDVNAPNKLSELCGYWMAGLLKHSQATTMLMAPTVNCYKRFGVQSHVSSIPNWGIDNRSCMLRLKINGMEGTYIENRSSGGGSNPYLTLAAVVAAGIDGIEKNCLFRKKRPATPSG